MLEGSADEPPCRPFADGCRQSGGCAHGFMRTYFKPLSSCSTADVQPGETIALLETRQQVLLMRFASVLPSRSCIPVVYSPQ